MSKNRLSEDGKRYTRKVAGSQFGTPVGATLSCFLCGKHEKFASGSWRRLIGKYRFVCEEHSVKPNRPEDARPV